MPTYFSNSKSFMYFLLFKTNKNKFFSVFSVFLLNFYSEMTLWYKYFNKLVKELHLISKLKIWGNVFIYLRLIN